MLFSVSSRSGLLRATALATLLAGSVLLPRAGHAASGDALDQGAMKIGDPLAMTIYLQPRSTPALERFDAALQDPASPLFHHFLSRDAFVAQFAPTDAQLAQVEARLVAMGYTIGAVFPNHLAIEVTGTAGAAHASFGVTLHRYQRGSRPGIVPVSDITIPAALSGLVRAVGGFDTLHPAHAGRMQASAAVRSAAAPAATAGGVPGSFAPADFEKRYDVLPLVQAGATGRGTTIGIVTLSDFKASDAVLFWKDYGIAVGADHLTKVDVDGGTDPGTPYADGDPGESDLDVQQSGAIAPNARVLAYVTPNISSATFLNGFEAAASDNLADTVSCSWGEAESDYYANLATGEAAQTGLLDAFHDVFLEMAAQGQTVFTDSDDNGAFEINRFDYPVFTGLVQTATPFYSIHHPSADPLVTAAGGTSVAFKAHYSGVDIDVPQQEAWSWTYYPLGALRQGEDPTTLFKEAFAVGGGGGVSIHFPLPDYQRGLAGIQATLPFQALYTIGTDGSRTLVTKAPAFFPGRNIPDLSANANPDAGYTLIQDGQLVTFYGGTSFVAPQFAGTTALLVERLGHRIGQLNPLLYRLAKSDAGSSPDIATGDNWGYLAHVGYDQTTGLGVLDARKLATGLAAFDR